METSRAHIEESLDTVRDARAANATRLTRGRAYWYFVGALLALLQLSLYLQVNATLPPIARVVVYAAAAAAIALVFHRLRPTSGSKIRPTARMAIPIIGLALVVGVISIAAGFGYSYWAGWPAIGAIVTVSTVGLIGARIEQNWAREASGVAG